MTGIYGTAKNWDFIILSLVGLYKDAQIQTDISIATTGRNSAILLPSKAMDSNDKQIQSGKHFNNNQSSTSMKKTGEAKVLKEPTGPSKVSAIVYYIWI